MNDFTTALLPVFFRGATLYVADVNDKPYEPMRPIVEGMGLDWAPLWKSQRLPKTASSD